MGGEEGVIGEKQEEGLEEMPKLRGSVRGGGSALGVKEQRGSQEA